jgi:hypothetical protein
MLNLTWVIGLTMSDWDLIPLAVAASHRMVATPWGLYLTKWLCGFGEVFLDEVGSYMGSAMRGTHQSSLRAMVITRNRRAAAGWWLRPSAAALAQFKGRNERGPAQTGVAQRPQARHGVTVVRNSIERQCCNQKRRLGFHSMWNEIRGSTTAFYRAFRSRITSTSWILFLSRIRFLFGEDFVLGRDFPHPPLVWTLLGATWMMESGWAALG